MAASSSASPIVSWIGLRVVADASAILDIGCSGEANGELDADDIPASPSMSSLSDGRKEWEALEFAKEEAP
jgi:hypothetical protein